MSRSYQYDVCLSFAGEDREYVRAIARRLSSEGLRVFFDEYEENNLWGKNLYEHLRHIYSKASRYCVIFISEHYIRKAWTRRESQSAQERALTANSEYILPIRLDDSELPGLLATIGYMRGTKTDAERIADSIREKVLPEVIVELQGMKDYLPPNIDRLIPLLPDAQRNYDCIERAVGLFFQSYKRLSRHERRVFGTVFAGGCPGELPDFVHINFDLLSRLSKVPKKKLRETLQGAVSLGFEAHFRYLDSQEDVTCAWTAVIPEAAEYFQTSTNFTVVPAKIFELLNYSYCVDHAITFAIDGNFMALSEISNIAIEH